MEKIKYSFLIAAAVLVSFMASWLFISMMPPLKVILQEDPKVEKQAASQEFWGTDNYFGKNEMKLTMDYKGRQQTAWIDMEGFDKLEVPLFVIFDDLPGEVKWIDVSITIDKKERRELCPKKK